MPPTITPVVALPNPLAILAGGTPVGGPPTPNPDAVFPEACLNFLRRDPTDAFLDVGMSGQISWNPVDGAEGYQVWVLTPGHRFIYDQIIYDTTVTIPGEVMIGTGIFAWEVMPLRDGDRMCQSLTGLFNLRRS